MRERFISLSYKRDLHKKLQRLEQGNISVQEYYAEFQRCGIHCVIVEDTEDKIGHFYGGLKQEIQDIVYHKEFYTIDSLFQLAMLAEKELQGCKKKNQREQH